MRTVFFQVREFVLRTVDKRSLGLMMLFLGVALWANYRFDIDARFVDVPRGSFMAAARYTFFYSIPFLLAFWLQRLFGGERRFWRDKRFWILIVLAPIVFALHDVAFMNLLAPGGISPFAEIVGNFFLRWIVCVTPIALYWRATKEEGEPFYGFTLGTLHLGPYLGLLALMVPLVAIASFQPDFLRAYPRAELMTLHHQLHFSSLQYAIYEVLYGLDFFFTEFFFRGFVVLAFAKVCGRQIILPMASFYVFIHFGKPAGEAISSFFGGTILGVIAYESGSIYGGIIVHVGIAWLMEAIAFAQKAWR